MKHLKTYYILCLIVVFISCSSNDEEDTAMTFDFGEATFDEPFVGLLKSRPQILVKSLQYPPFSWVAPDTTLIERTLEITFNEECLRSKSQAIIQFTDKTGTSYSGIDVYCNDTLCSMGEITVNATTGTSQITHVKLKILPSVIGDSTLTGFVCLQGTELDRVNNTDIQHQREAIGLWKCNHELGWPIMLWLLWLICALLIIAAVIFIIYLLCKYIIIPICKAISSIKLNLKPFHNHQISHNYNNSKKQSNEKKIKNDEDWREEIRRRTGWTNEIIMALRSKEEAEIYINTGLKQGIVGGRFALINPNIDWRAYNCRKEWLKKKLADWNKWKDYNNADLIGEGYPPRDEHGDPYELHHIGQKQDSPYAELCWNDHMGKGNNKILHPKRESEIDRQLFDGEKSQYWKNRFKLFSEEELKEIYGKSYVKIEHK